MVNALSDAVDGQALSSADPASWPSSGVAARVPFATVDAEAEWILAVAQLILANVPSQRVAVIARTNARRRFIDDRVHDTDVAYYRWDDPVLDSQTASIVRATLDRLDVVALKETEDQISYLWNLAQGEDLQDPDTRKYLTEGLGWVIDSLDDGFTPADIRARIKIGDNDTLLSASGLHLLNGHIGKGQQFDWVFVIGLEEGCLPDFRSTTTEAHLEELRVLSVMISRARHGVVLTRSGSVPARSGVAYSKEPSSFLRYFDNVPECQDLGRLTAWLEAVDWSAIEKR
jgi:DNA helicase-2/ATP-dependent DNA helicase PcrA